jgi:FkbM family methyltransferase
MTFSKLARQFSPVRLALRVLQLVPDDAVVPILRGPSRGRRWIAGSGLNRYWLGSFEPAKQRMLARWIQPGDVVYDVGANVGIYTLLAAGVVGKSGHVTAFEPVARNVAYLEKHVALNRLPNVTIAALALGDRAGEAAFQPGDTPTTGRLADDGGLTVPVRTLDSYLAEAGVRPPDVVKIDVEGAEYAVLQGGAQCFSQQQPVIFLATHGLDVHRACLAQLREWGYTLESLTDDPLDLDFQGPPEAMRGEVLAYPPTRRPPAR